MKKSLTVLSLCAILALAGCGKKPTSEQQSVQPSVAPSEQPSVAPSEQPSVAPSEQPSVAPSEQPSVEPSEQPSVEPSEQPSVEPSEQPSVEPSEQPSEQPSEEVSSPEEQSSEEVPQIIYTDENWEQVDNPQGYSFEEGKIICRNEEELDSTHHWNTEKANFLLSKDELNDSYEIKVKYAGTVEGDVEEDEQAGIVAWYKDKNNYVVIGTRWASWDRPHEIRSLFIGRMINGVYNSSDFWTDNCGVYPIDGCELTVQRVLTKSGYKFTFDLKGDNHAVKSGELVVKDANSETAKVGIFGANDAFEFTDFQTQPVVVNTKLTYSAEIFGKAATLVLDFKDNTFVLSAEGEPDETGTYATEGKITTLTPTSDPENPVEVKLNDNDNSFELIIPEPPVEPDLALAAGEAKVLKTAIIGDYTLSFEFEGNVADSAHDEVILGASVWMVDENNFLNLYVQWSNADRPHEIREMQLTGKINGESTGWFDMWMDGNGLLPADGGKLVITKQGGKFIAQFFKKDGTKIKEDSKTFTLGDAAYNVGLYAQGDAFDLTNYSFVRDLTANYEVTGGATVTDVAATLPKGSTVGFKQQFSGDYELSFTYEGTITENVTEGVAIGAYAWYVDNDNYIKVYGGWESWDRPQEMRNLEITGVVGGVDISWCDFFTDGCGLKPGDAAKLVISKTGKVFNVKLYNGETLVQAGSRTIDGLDETAKYKVFAYAQNDQFTLTNLDFNRELVLAKGAQKTVCSGITGDYELVLPYEGTITENVTEGVAVGAYAWYVDNDNYIKVYGAWESWDRAHEMRNLEIVGKIGGVDLNWCDFFTDNCGLKPGDAAKLVISKTGKVFNVKLYNGETLVQAGSRTIDDLDESAQYNVVIYAQNDQFTFPEGYEFTKK